MPNTSNEEQRVAGAMFQFAVNLAAQLALADGGSFTMVRAVAARLIDQSRGAPGSAIVEETVLSAIEQAALLLIKQGVEVRR
jgi:hypothetical protein